MPYRSLQTTALVVLAALALPGAGFAQHEHHHPPTPAAETITQEPVKLTIPDVSLVDQDGKPVLFYTDLVRGKVVLMNFVFTTCTTICPPMGATFAKVQKLLGDRKDVHLISVSVDPATDTPERLKAWAGKLGGGPGWTLVTGDREAVTRLLKALGVYTARLGDHSPLVLAGNDARGTWTRAYGLAPPAKLVEILDGMADVRKETRW
jgi:protein SCO1/2